MAYSTNACMVSYEQAKKMHIQEIIRKTNWEKVKATYLTYVEMRNKAILYEIALDYASK